MRHLNIAVLTLTLLLIACPQIPERPDDIVEKYLDALLQKRHDETHSYLSRRDKDLKALCTYRYEAAIANSLRKNVILRNITVDIRGVRYDKERKHAEVKVVYLIPAREVVDRKIREKWEEAEQEAKRLLNTSQRERSFKVKPTSLQAETERIIVTKLSEMDLWPIFEKKRYKTTFLLTREPDGWKILLNWDGKGSVSYQEMLGRIPLEL